jgi:Nucleoside phosphorylase
VGVVLLVAAEARELRSLERRLTRVSRLPWRLDYAVTGEGIGGRWVLAANGPGPGLAREAVDTVFEHEEIDVVVSTGYCGALDERFSVGDIIVASRVKALETGLEYTAVPPDTRGRFWLGEVASLDRVVGTVEEKRKLCASGSMAVEMEAAAVADAASRRGVRFGCVRAVSDTAHEGFDLDLNAARGRDGRFRGGKVLLQVLKRPAAGVPELWRLMRNSSKATAALGEFLANCRF